MIIGIPKEIFSNENRVAVTPGVAAKLLKFGYEVQIEKRAGVAVDVRRMIDASEVANLVTFLASPLASAITGEAIATGGGVGSAVFQ